MSDLLSQSIQDYLKQIYDLSKNGVPASTTDLAARLGIAPASVTGMIQRLSKAKPKLVHYHKHQGVTLTDAGNRAALEVIRHHRLLEAWLVQTLGYSWDEVHQEAERLEHVLSEEMEARIAAALGHPARDPHGDIIPTSALVMPADNSKPLSVLRPPQEGLVIWVRSEDSSFLRHLEGLGLVPGAKIKVTGYSPFDNNITIQTGSVTRAIGMAITSRIFVDVLQDKHDEVPT
jgi:DtxR family transcriptional regulator, Mn-dependent transcriptional regulator